MPRAKKTTVKEKWGRNLHLLVMDGSTKMCEDNIPLKGGTIEKCLAKYKFPGFGKPQISQLVNGGECKWRHLFLNYSAKLTREMI